MREQQYKRPKARPMFDALDERVVPAVALQQVSLGGVPVIAMTSPAFQFVNNQFSIRSLPMTQTMRFVPGARPLAALISPGGIFSPNQMNMGFNRVLPSLAGVTTAATVNARTAALQSLANRLATTRASNVLSRELLAQALFQSQLTRSSLMPFFPTTFTSPASNSGLLPFFLPNFSPTFGMTTPTTTTNTSAFIPGATSALTTFNGANFNPFSPTMTSSALVFPTATTSTPVI